MQALTSDLAYAGTQEPSAGSDMAQAVAGQMGAATADAKAFTNDQKMKVLRVANQQQQVGGATLSELARIETSGALTSAKAKAQERAALAGATAQLAGSYILQGAKNKAGGGKWHSPAKVNEMGQQVNKGGQTRAEFAAQQLGSLNPPFYGQNAPTVTAKPVAEFVPDTVRGFGNRLRHTGYLPPRRRG